MTSRNRHGSLFFSWRWPHVIFLMLTPVLVPRPWLSAAFLYTPIRQRIQRSWRPA